jgi:glycosyltransferase involved in cell wall biosynthesis
MKILMVMAEYFHGGGYLPALLPLAEGLREMGHTVVVIGASNEDEIDGIKGFKYSSAIPWYFSCPMKAWLKKNASSFDLIHINGLWSFPQLIAAYYARRFNISYIVSPHGIFIEPSRYRGFKKTIYSRLFSRKILAGAHSIHTTSMLEFNGVIAAGINKRIDVIPWSVAAAAFDKSSACKEGFKKWPQLREKKILLYISRLSPEKGLEELIFSLSDVKKVHSNFKLVIAGEGRSYQAHLEKLISKLGLDESVLFTGLTLGEEKNFLLGIAHFFVLPSHGENFSFAVAEALAAGIPVVTTNRTPWSEIATVDAGRYVSPSAPALSTAINEMLSFSNQQLHDMGARGAKLIDEQYSISTISLRFSILYSNAVAHSKVSTP